MLAQCGHTVSCLDRRPNLESMSSLGLEPIAGDIRDRELLCHIIPEHDGIIHLAGLLGTSELIDDPISAINTNLIGSVNVFEGCKRAKRLGKQVPCIQISVGNHFMDNPYSISRHSSERFANMYNKEHGTDIRIVRGLNAYGEFQKAFPVRKIVPTFMRAALRNEPLLVHGTVQQIMDMIYVGDLARVLIATLKSESVDREISAGTGRRLTVNDIAAKIISETRSDSKVEYCPMRAGEPVNSVVLGEPETLLKVNVSPDSLMTFEEGIRRTAAWYSEHKGFLD